MREKVLNKCKLFANNRNTITKAFTWDSEYMSLAAASIFAANGADADTEKLKACEEILRKETDFFSEFRGNIKLPIVCKMAMSDDPVAYLNKIQEIYSVMNKSKFAGNEYRILASIIIYDRVPDGEYESYINRTNELYSMMSKKHPFLTGYEDIPFAAMLAISDFDVDKLIEDMEISYKILKKKFGDADAVQSLSHVLALQSISPEVKCEKVFKIFDSLNEAKHKYGTSYELPTLGSLALLNVSENEVVSIISEADDFLKTQKGFGGLVVGASERRMFAAQMLISECASDDSTINNAVMNSLLSISITIEMCLMISIITAST